MTDDSNCSDVRGRSVVTIESIVATEERITSLSLRSVLRRKIDCACDRVHRFRLSCYLLYLQGKKSTKIIIKHDDF